MPFVETDCWKLWSPIHHMLRARASRLRPRTQKPPQCYGFDSYPRSRGHHSCPQKSQLTLPGLPMSDRPLLPEGWVETFRIFTTTPLWVCYSSEEISQHVYTVVV